MQSRQPWKRPSATRLIGAVVLTVLSAGLTSTSSVSAAPLVAAAGDIACDPDSAYFNRGFGRGQYCRQRDTSRLLGDATAVLTLGDTQYEHSSLSNIRASYDRSWGRYKSRTRPAIGNHEYAAGLKCSPTRCPTSDGADGYFDYFGARAGPRGRAYYSYDLGEWHVVVLNSMCSAVGGCREGSRQERWLRADLARNRGKKCTLAYWHHPSFSSGQSRGYPYYGAFWRALHRARADVVLAGHDHVYERFARQSATGLASSTGPVQFMVGTGGKNLGRFVTRQPNSARRVSEHGVLRMRLLSKSYQWRFARAGDNARLDGGSASCV